MSTKTCIRCGERQPLDAYYHHAMMADGHLNKCIELAALDARMRHHTKRHDPEWVAAERARGREKFERLGYGDRYRPRTAKQRQRHNVTNARWHRAHPNVKRAQALVQRGLREGWLKRPESCSECGATGTIWAHHDDYVIPLDIRWLCPKCCRRSHRAK